MESFASPDYLFYGKSHAVKQLYCKNGCKKPFLFAFNTTTRGDGPKWNPAQIDAQTTLYLPRSHLSGFIQQIRQYLVRNANGRVEKIEYGMRGLLFRVKNNICKRHIFL